jgi:hypothetical protein
LLRCNGNEAASQGSRIPTFRRNVLSSFWMVSKSWKIFQLFTDLFPRLDFLLKTWFCTRKRTYGKTPRIFFMYIHTYIYTSKRQQIQ